MVYLKSFIAGTAALVMAAALSPILMGVYFLVVYRNGADEGAAWDPTSFARQPLTWAILVLIFVAGFVWELRRTHPE